MSKTWRYNPDYDLEEKIEHWKVIKLKRKSQGKCLNCGKKLHKCRCGERDD